MAKDPAFLFYPNDYIGGTMGMTFEEKGAYIELLMLQFNRGHMTKHMIGQTVGQLWVNLEDKFTKDKEGLWYNERLEYEKTKRKNFTQSRHNNVLGNNQHNKNKKKEGGHMTKHMEDGNENEIINRKEKMKIPELSEVLKYFSEKGYKTEIAEKAFEYYETANWKDSTGKKVKNWKQKMIAVWFKDENKINKKIKHESDFN